MTARVLYSMPATAICWSTYEFFKFYLCGGDHDNYKSSISGINLLSPRDANALIPASIVADAAVLQQSPKKHSAKEYAYLLPETPTVVMAEGENSSDGGAAAANMKESAYLAAATPPPAQPPSPGAIKTVCDLSSSVATPALNLHTRHTDVKSPTFDRVYSSR